jgi:uncharacterized protein (TIGR03437 family)
VIRFPPTHPTTVQMYNDRSGCTNTARKSSAISNTNDLERSPPMTFLSRRDIMTSVLRLLAVAPLARRCAAAPSLPPLKERQVSVPRVDDQGNIVSRYSATSLYFVEDLGGGFNLEIAQIPGGTFQMGSTFPSPSYNPGEQPVHQVRVPPFSLGVYPVTRGQWRQVSTFPKVSRDLSPIFRLNSMPLEVENQLPIDDIVFFLDAQEFCARVNFRTGRMYRLPTEAEWEYACRAGTTTNYHFGDGISLQVANYNALQRPLGLTPVGSKAAPNRFGLHDMHGNVLEWCLDRVHPDYFGAPVDNGAWIDSGDPNSRVCRGGNYDVGAENVRSASRRAGDIRGTFSGFGFRVALSLANELFDPQFGAQDVFSAASMLAGPVAPGQIITIFGNNIGPSTAQSFAFDDDGRVPTQLGGIQVLFDGIPGRILFASSKQVNVIVPYAVDGQAATQVILKSQGQTSAPVSVQVARSAPALFTVDGSGSGQASALNEDGTLNSRDNPAARGSRITLFGTGEGQTDPPGVDGQVASGTGPKPVLPVQVMIGGVQCDVQSVGGAPGAFAGLLQITARLAPTVPSGSQPVVLVVGDAISPSAASVAVS